MAKRKTSAFLRKLIERHIEKIAYIDEMIRVKTTVAVESQADHIKAGTVAEWEARAAGINALLEDALFIGGCYAGFMYQGEQKRRYHPTGAPGEGGSWSTHYESVGSEHPEFKEWRRFYFTR